MANQNGGYTGSVKYKINTMNKKGPLSQGLIKKKKVLQQRSNII